MAGGKQWGGGDSDGEVGKQWGGDNSDGEEGNMCLNCPPDPYLNNTPSL